MLQHVVHDHGVKFLVVKSGLIETTAKNRDSESRASMGCRFFIHFLALHVPSSGPQPGKALSVAAPDFEDPPRRQTI